MPTDEQFLRQIHAHPDDDLPRLIYADWLEEQGNPRAEFIRLQIEEARLRSCDFPTWREFQQRFAALRNRCDELRQKHEAEWLTKPLYNLQKAHPGISLEYKRGFPERMLLRQHRSKLLTPLMGLGILDAYGLPVEARLLEDIHSLFRLDQLRLGVANILPAHLESLSAMTSLKHLILDRTVGTDRDSIPQLSRFTHLESLRIYDTRMLIRDLQKLSDSLPMTVVAVSQPAGGQTTKIQHAGWNWLVCSDRLTVEDRCSVELPAEWVVHPDHGVLRRYALQHPLYAAIRQERFGRIEPDLRLQFQLGELLPGISAVEVLQAEFQPGEYERPYPGVPLMIPDCTAELTATATRAARRVYPSEITERVLAALWCRDREYAVLRCATEAREYARWEPLFHAIARSFRWE